MNRSFANFFQAVALATLALSSVCSSHAFPGGPSLLFNMPESGSTGVTPNTQVTFFFSETMAQSQSIEWSANVNPANLSYSWSIGLALTVTAQGGFPANATITWKLNPTAGNASNFKSAAGTELPAGQFQGSFTTGAGGGDPGDPGDPCAPTGGEGLGGGTIIKAVNYTQTGDQAPVLDTEGAATFSGFYSAADNQNVTAVTISGPGTTITLTNIFGTFLTSQDFLTAEALEAGAPAGTYTINATGAGSGSVTVGSTAQVPTPRFNNLPALATMDPTQPFTLTFNAFTGAGVGDGISVNISATDATNEFHAPDFCKHLELPNTATSVVIPANTFRAGQKFRGQISFSRGSFNTNAIPNTSLSGMVSKTTSFNQEGGGQEPRAPMWTALTRNPDGTLTYTITGDTGLNLSIEASNTPTGGWTPLSTALLATGSFQFTINPNTPNLRFFRARVL